MPWRGYCSATFPARMFVPHRLICPYPRFFASHCVAPRRREAVFAPPPERYRRHHRPPRTSCPQAAKPAAVGTPERFAVNHPLTFLPVPPPWHTTPPEPPRRLKDSHRRPKGEK